MTQRPGFTHRTERHGLVGPFSGRQLVAAFGAVVVAVIVLVAVTTPLGNTADGPGTVDPRPTQYIIGPAPQEGLQAGDLAPEFEVPLDDGSTYQLTDLDGRPIRLADLRGKAVWVNFWASWCPPCQQETPIIRELAERYRDAGLVVVGIAVQETSPADIRAYAERFNLRYTIGFDASGHVFRRYRVFGLPTQFFIRPDGVIDAVGKTVDEATAVARIEAILPEGSTPAP
ncbi:MAG: TlpA disulfide reductase family protein [Candidatus Limnocylindrales bacterium]|nr:TlpA disulfide reductase family protein [Candidatus Limnocylindrales bacterium]